MRMWRLQRKQPGSSQTVYDHREREGGGLKERRSKSQVQLGFRPHNTIMLVSPPSLLLRCPLPGCWMALVTVQRSPTPSTSSSPCVSVRTAVPWTLLYSFYRLHQTNISSIRRATWGYIFGCLFCRLLTVTQLPCLCAAAHAWHIATHHFQLQY